MKSVREREQQVNPQWVELLKRAVNEPGLVLEAYKAFHNYSLGNQIAAAYQCRKRGIALGPIHTFNGWKNLQRHVKKGEKGILLCMPITVKSKDKAATEPEEFIQAFVWRANWFVMSQTEGVEYQPPVVGTWDKAQALAVLGIQEVAFSHPNGNVQGYAKDRCVAVSPIAQLPHKTLLHEIAHVVLGHTTHGDCSDSESLPYSLREVEAESIALLLTETLQLCGSEYCRGYIQYWWSSGEDIPEKSAQRIFSAAQKILSAGKSRA
jgi:antirestriction protein ArdC